MSVSSFYSLYAAYTLIAAAIFHLSWKLLARKNYPLSGFKAIVNLIY